MREPCCVQPRDLISTKVSTLPPCLLVTAPLGYVCGRVRPGFVHGVADLCTCCCKSMTQASIFAIFSALFAKAVAAAGMPVAAVNLAQPRATVSLSALSAVCSTCVGAGAPRGRLSKLTTEISRIPPHPPEGALTRALLKPWGEVSDSVLQNTSSLWVGSQVLSCSQA